MSKFQMTVRIERAGIFKGRRELSNEEAKHLIGSLRRKPIGNGGDLERWMKYFNFRKEYRHENRGTHWTYILWWVRE